ncbi:MAG: 3-hydroxylacyl-(acyl carrier protein) [Rhodospirillaceae bacterium]|nr:MAG: 3-hydroxylacyl-(acyl carrier protein) [Rhodospirillaceae bacterium]TNC98848.1 MAG: 3-hydroxylacyl-(acyl carrier protein) dehydratase [Stygiobacter sp.]
MTMTDLLPHRPPMVLVDRLVAFDDDSAHVQAEIRPDHPFLRPLGVAAHVGMEMMAQACGAHVGALARQAGDAIRLGFLLGTRSYVAHLSWFPPAAVLDVLVRRVFNEDGMGVYDCRILLAGAEAAAAQLTLYQPPDQETALARLRGEHG